MDAGVVVLSSRRQGSRKGTSRIGTYELEGWLAYFQVTTNPGYLC